MAGQSSYQIRIRGRLSASIVFIFVSAEATHGSTGGGWMHQALEVKAGRTRQSFHWVHSHRQETRSAGVSLGASASAATRRAAREERGPRPGGRPGCGTRLKRTQQRRGNASGRKSTQKAQHQLYQPDQSFRERHANSIALGNKLCYTPFRPDLSRIPVSGTSVGLVGNFGDRKGVVVDFGPRSDADTGFIPDPVFWWRIFAHRPGPRNLAQK